MTPRVERLRALLEEPLHQPRERVVGRGPEGYRDALAWLVERR